MKPGIYDGIPEADYHADSALSQSQAKALLDCPARFAWEREHPIQVTTPMEHGTIVHALALGTPDPHVVVDADSWRTKAAREAADEVRARGLIPVLADDLTELEGCAKAIREHPYVGAILESEGKPEQSMWWRDPDYDVECRGRVDWLTVDDAGTPVLMDLKTMLSVAGNSWEPTVAKYGYHVQAAAYLDGFRHITGQDATFLFVAAERQAPHLIRVYSVTHDVIKAGLRAWQEALHTYRTCTDANEWPGYSPHPIPFDLPPWAA